MVKLVGGVRFRAMGGGGLRFETGGVTRKVERKGMTEREKDLRKERKGKMVNGYGR